MSPQELQKLCNDREDENMVLMKVNASQSKKLANIAAYYVETKVQMADTLKRLTTDRDKVRNELKELQEENRRYRDELEKRDRSSRRTRRDKQPTVAISDSEMETMPRKIQALSKELEDTEKKKEELITNLIAITTASQMIEKINEEHRSDLQEKRKELDDITERIAAYEAINKANQRKKKRMKDEVESEKAEQKEIEKQNACFKLSIEDVYKKVDDFKAQKEEILCESEQIDEDFAIGRFELKEVMNKKQKEIDFVKRQIADLQAKTDAKISPKKRSAGLFRKFGRLFRRQ